MELFNVNSLPKVGVYFGKFFPPHRGHLTAIMNAATQCQELYVVISHHEKLEQDLADKANLPMIPWQLREQWLSAEVRNMEHIKVVVMHETDLPVYPNGWPEWCQRMRDTVKKNIDVFFMGEKEYAVSLNKFFPEAKTIIFDPERTNFHISATLIRSNPFEYWDYILGAARPFFTKNILIAGTESCAKTSLTKMLAKIYNTSWSEEYGRYYADNELGGCENYYTHEDFARIAHNQVEQDYDAMRHANRICLFDTDATITQYYSKLYTGEYNDIVEKYIRPDKYDVVFLMKPDVTWVDDGMRFNGDQKRREELHQELKKMYLERGFKNIIEVGGSYNERFLIVKQNIDRLFFNK